MITKPAESPFETDETEAAPTRPPQEDRRSALAHGGPPEARPTPGRKLHGWSWLLIVAIGAGLWFSRQHWLPWVATVFPKAATAPSKPDRAIPVRSAVV